MKRIFSVISICLFLCFSNGLFAQEIFTAIIQRDVQKVKELLKQDSSLISVKNPRGFYPTITLDGELIYTDAKNKLHSAKINGEQITNIRKLNEHINTDPGGYNSMISPGGKFFFFTSNRKGSEDIYWIDAQVIQDLKPRQ